MSSQFLLSVNIITYNRYFRSLYRPLASPKSRFTKIPQLRLSLIRWCIASLEDGPKASGLILSLLLWFGFSVLSVLPDYMKRFENGVRMA
jgi:hypothetical protein